VTKLLVSEIYGPVFQGEGPDLGKPCHFLRLGGCSIQREWCDTKYTWDSTTFDLSAELTLMTVDEVRKQLMELSYTTGIKRLVISGGEPMQQQVALAELLTGQQLFSAVELETSGAIAPTMPRSLGILYNVSPKLSHANTKRPISFEALIAFRERNARFKFVVRNEADLLEVARIKIMVGIRDEMIWIMPLGITKDDVHERFRLVAEEVVKRRWNLTTRLHVLAYGSRRGV